MVSQIQTFEHQVEEVLIFIGIVMFDFFVSEVKYQRIFFPSIDITL